MSKNKYNCIILLGPTAVGKTSLGVRLAHHLNTSIISADSRQTYKGLDLGSGKDIQEYNYQGRQIPYYMIDITTLDTEYNVFNYQQDFYKIFDQLKQKGGTPPLVVGGTGMYVDSIVRDYDLIPVPENPEFHAQLESMNLEELVKKLLALRPNHHNTSDFLDKERVIHAIEIESYKQSDDSKWYWEEKAKREKVNPFIIGTTIPRDELHKNIRIRLEERIKAGMIEEVQELHNSGYSWQRLDKLGLEYRYVSDYLQNKYSSIEEMTDRLYHAIAQFAKRQETWFRGMEKKGVTIHWLPKVTDKEEKYTAALKLIEQIDFSF